MAETCPLKTFDLRQMSEVVDKDGWIWEPNIPAACLDCLVWVDETIRSKGTIHYEAIEEVTGEPFGPNQARYHEYGIRLIGLTSLRLGREVGGVDLSALGNLAHPKEEVSTYSFACAKQNDFPPEEAVVT